MTPPVAAVRRSFGGPRAAIVAAVACAALAATLLRWPPQDAGGDIAVWLQQLPWVDVFAAVVVPVLAAAHYLLSGVAVRAASGGRVPLRTTTYAQLAAAAANRLVPNGVAGAGLNIRYLQRSGAATSHAVASLAALGVVGGLTDAAWTAAVVTVGPAAGVSGAQNALGQLAAHGVRAGARAPWLILGLMAVFAFVAIRRRSLRPPSIAAGVRGAGAHVMSLVRRPRQLAAMALASMGTTAALSLGFAATVVAVGRGHSLPGIGTLLAVYLVGAAIGGATPLPAFLGVTEAALVAGLVLFGVPATTAIVATLLFRGVAFWVPVPLGFLVARRLRAERLL